MYETKFLIFCSIVAVPVTVFIKYGFKALSDYIHTKFIKLLMDDLMKEPGFKDDLARNIAELVSENLVVRCSVNDPGKAAILETREADY